jgi:NAD(P)-dependent dehydrogenase (short-subunit alcohol dehydrogenase family)
MSKKTAVVTGSTKGIGKGYAKEFLNRGINVVISGRSQQAVDQALADLKDECKGGARVAGTPCEMSDAAQVQALWDFAKKEFGGVDIWVNNAGFARSGVTLLQLTPEEIETMVRGNVIGTINGCQVAVRGMTEQGHGHIYNTYGAGSDGRVLPGMIGYGTTKSAVRYFTESLIKELKGKPIKVGMISPGMNITENMINQMKQVPPPVRPKVMRPINLLGDYVETTTPWIVARMLEDDKTGTHIKWLTTGKLLKRLLTAKFNKRDLFARYDLGGAPG